MLRPACGSVGPCSIGSCLGWQTLVASLAQTGTRTHPHSPGLLLSRGGEGGRGFWTQNLVYQKWPDQIFPIVNFVLSPNGHFGLGKGGRGFWGRGPPPLVFLIILKKPWGDALNPPQNHPRAVSGSDLGEALSNIAIISAKNGNRP